MQYTVRYSCLYAKPSIGQKVVGKILNIIGDPSSNQCIVMSEIEGCELVCITKQIDMDRYKLQVEQKSSDEESENDSEDSVFDKE